jgi:hypothetical protein
MTFEDESLQAAYELLDRNKFAEARDAYRAALSAGHARRFSFGNLALAEQEEAGTFLRTLIAQRPEWGEPRLALVDFYKSNHKWKQALAECDAILEKGLFPEVWRVRLRRYVAAVGARSVATARSDFEFFWAQTEERGKPLLRRALTRTLAAIDHINGTEVITAIRDAFPGEAALRTFLDAKLAELQALAALHEPWERRTSPVNWNRG